MVVHAATFAEDLRRTDLATGMTKEIAFVNCLGRAIQIARIDLPDKQRNVDARRAGVHTRCIITKQATAAFIIGLRGIHERLQLRKILRKLNLVFWCFEFSHCLLIDDG
jgi:hypothetical protein